MGTWFTPAQRAVWLTRISIAAMACGVAALAILVWVVGWPLASETRATLGLVVHGVLVGFVVLEALRFLLQEHPWTYLKAHRLEAGLTLAVAVELLASSQVEAWAGRTFGFNPGTLAMVVLAFDALAVLGMLTLRGLRHLGQSRFSTITPGQLFILSFVGLILVGTLLLKTPQASRQGLAWVDALFLSTSAVCVTGLTPVDISTTLSPTGLWILLGLIQVGGLGVMTLTSFFTFFIGSGASLRTRMDLQDLLSEDNLSHIGRVLLLTLTFTLGMELLGVLAIHGAMKGILPDGERLSFAVFHSVSAFCNAGFSTLSANLADPRVAGHTAFLSTIMTLIVLGGLGIPVVKAFVEFLHGHLRFRLGLTQRVPARLTANSRIVLFTTLLLLVGGTLVVYVTEFVLGNGPMAGSGGLTATFHAVTARTAGFNNVPMTGMLPATAMVMILLMFIGGSPSGTAGGIKTSTLAVAALSLRRVLRGRRDIEAFRRRFGEDTANRALSIILVAVGFLSLSSITLMALHPELSPFDLIFEATSALGTVGLSRDLTPKLSSEAKLVVIFTMLVGRVGVLTFVGSFMPRPAPPAFRYPETSIVLN